MAKKILKGAVNFATGGVLGLASSLLSKKKKKAEPAEEGPKVMPLADDEKVRAAKQASLLKQRQRSGRSSTILGGASSETLG